MSLFMNTPVGEIVGEKPSRAVVFEQFGIDYCCGGATPLLDQCSQKSVDVNAVLTALREHDNRGHHPDDASWNERPPSALVNHILTTHHEYLRNVLPQLSRMTAKVAERHGDKKEEYVTLKQVFDAMHNELNAHMMKEEQILFPAIERWEQAGMPAGGGRNLTGPIRVMLTEHDSAGDALARMRALTDGYTPYEGACQTVESMMSALAELERDLHMHIHLENNILFPCVLETSNLGSEAVQ